MKWIALLIFLGAIAPATMWLRANQRHLPAVVMALGFVQFVDGLLHLVIAPVSWQMWPGFVKGMEISVVDVIAIVLVLSAPAGKRIAHLRWPTGLFMAAVALSAAHSNVAMASLFYLWQLTRVVLLITAVAFSCRDPRVPRALMLGLSFGIALQAFFSLKEHAAGTLQAAGTFGHQNQLGMITHFVIMPTLAMLLGARKGGWLWLGPLGGMVAVILTASRATIGLAGAGVVLVLALSMMRRPSARKTTVAIAGVVGLAIASPFAIASLDQRFERGGALSTDYDERAAFERAATAMLHDHPFGVGANNYVVVANAGGYSARAGVAIVSGSLSAHVHNAYLLAAAEMGYGGTAAFILMFAWPVIVALRCAWRFRKDPRGELLVGLGGALMIVAVHSHYEWIFVTYSTQYMYAIAVGLIAGIAQQMGFWSRRPRRRTIRPAEPGITAQEPLNA